MDNLTLILLVVVAIIVFTGLMAFVVDRNYRKALLDDFRQVRVGDKFSRSFVSPHYPCETSSETVIVIYKYLDAGGSPWVTYEYADEHIPYDVPYEDFISMFYKIHE